tara:strand:- start:473 stop:1273 length:801 start_codon:yes stop_codon:yes gene_type:complete
MTLNSPSNIQLSEQGSITTSGVQSQLSQNLDVTGLKSIKQTIDVFNIGDALEKTGRHYKRVAIAAEYLSGRNMEEFYREVGITSDTGRTLILEAKTFGLTVRTAHNDSYKLSQAIPGSRAANEFKKLPQEVKEVIREKIVQDPSLLLTIKDLKEENERLAKDALDGRRIAAKVDELQSQLNAVTNNEATTLAEAKRELDFTLQEFMSWQRKIDSLSNNLFTHNDPNTITQLESVLTVILQSFIRRKEQFIQGSSTESAIECTVSRI